MSAVPGKEGVRLRARFLALAQLLADRGKLTWEQGHPLEPPYQLLYEFKPKPFRVMAVRDGRFLLVTNLAKKGKPKVQNRDYDLAVRLWTDHLKEKNQK